MAPHAGRLVLFLVDGCLHKVEPCFATRFALTNWWLEPNFAPGQPTDVSVSIRSVHTTPPLRYAVLPPSAPRDVMAGLEAMRARG